jgi:hypothetical protein
MIRLRGVPIADEDARELARRLREHALVAVGIAERVERPLVAEGGSSPQTHPRRALS